MVIENALDLEQKSPFSAYSRPDTQQAVEYVNGRNSFCLSFFFCFLFFRADALRIKLRKTKHGQMFGREPFFENVFCLDMKY